MKTPPVMRKLFLIMILFIIVGLTTSCTRESSSGPRAWIDSPRGGASIGLNTPITVISHAYAREGLAEIVLYVNGEAYQRTTPSEPGANFSEFSQEWLPTQPGTYSLQVRAYDINGDSGNPVTISVNVGGEAVAEAVAPAVPEEPPTATNTPEISETPSVTPVISETPTMTATPTEIPPEALCPPQAIALKNSNCRSGPGSAYPIIGSLNQGESSTVVGRNNDSTWWVIERPGGSGNCWIWAELVELSSNECDIPIIAAPPLPPTPTNTPTSTPTPTPTTEIDNTPPPAPNQLKPLNGQDMGCIADTILRWEAVSDPSGIAEYQVELQLHPGDNNWADVPGSIFSGIGGTEKAISVECGWEYRWRVRAVDGAGNVSNWSGWFTFVVPLT